jgi:LysM repeat protein
MKKLFIFLLVAVFCAGLSCKTTPTGNEPEINQELSQLKEPTQQMIDDSLRAIINKYQGKLDMTGARDYTVRWGDTLSKIARRQYGGLTNVGQAGSRNGFYYPVIVLASPNDRIVDPDLIYPGIRLKIIDLKRNLANPEARQAIKDFLMDISRIYRAKNKPREEAGLIRLSNSL